jgi:hypothetical protein
LAARQVPIEHAHAGRVSRVKGEAEPFLIVLQRAFGLFLPGDVLHRARHLDGLASGIPFQLPPAAQVAQAAVRQEAAKHPFAGIVPGQASSEPCMHGGAVFGMNQGLKRLDSRGERVRRHAPKPVGLFGPCDVAVQVINPTADMGDALGLGQHVVFFAQGAAHCEPFDGVFQ